MDDSYEAPNPLPFPGRDAGGTSGLDQIEAVLHRAQSQLNEVTTMIDDDIASLRLHIPGRHDDDDRPWAA